MGDQTKDHGDLREDLGDQRGDLGDQRDVLGGQREDLSDQREDLGNQGYTLVTKNISDKISKLNIPQKNIFAKNFSKKIIFTKKF